MKNIKLKKEIRRQFRFDFYTNRTLNSAVNRLNKSNPKKKMTANKLVRILILLYAKDVTRTKTKGKENELKRDI